MESVTAIFHNGRVELAQPVDWPDGTQVEVKRIAQPQPRVDWLSLPPLDVGEFRELTSEDDLLGEMLDDSGQSAIEQVAMQNGPRQVSFEEFEAGLDELDTCSAG
jgi:hypothetical protein